MREEKMSEANNNMTFDELLKKVMDTPLPSFNANDYSPEQVREIVSLMRKLMDEAQLDPEIEKRYETTSPTFQDMYDIFQKLADMQETTIEDKNEDKEKDEGKKEE